MLELGADVPLCFAQKTALVFGVGEIIYPIKIPNKLYIVLIYPQKHCSTESIFKAYNHEFSQPIEQNLQNWNDNFLNELKNTKNDLTLPAIKNIPDIQIILDKFEAQEKCIFSRMTGSGSCCFGLFKTQQDSKDAAEKLSKENPQYWVKPVILNSLI